MVANGKTAAAKRDAAAAEQRRLQPLLQRLVQRTKELQTDMEKHISRKYHMRPVHITGATATLWWTLDPPVSFHPRFRTCVSYRFAISETCEACIDLSNQKLQCINTFSDFVWSVARRIVSVFSNGVTWKFHLYKTLLKYFWIAILAIFPYRDDEICWLVEIYWTRLSPLKRQFKELPVGFMFLSIFKHLPIATKKTWPFLWWLITNYSSMVYKHLIKCFFVWADHIKLIQFSQSNTQLYELFIGSLHFPSHKGNFS